MMMLLAYLYACRYGYLSFPGILSVGASCYSGIEINRDFAGDDCTGLAMIWKGYEMESSCIFPEKCGFVQGLPARF